jgi:hypothetical protein
MVAVVDDLRQQQRERLEKELLLASEALERAYKPIASGWRADLGPVAIRVTASSGLITRIYVLFNVLCFVFGVAFIFLNELFRALGIALVVGALFSFGTFMAQWWDHAWQRQNVTIDRAFNSGYDDKRYAKLQRLAKEYLELYEKLEGLHDDVSGHDSIPVILNEDPAD